VGRMDNTYVGQDAPRVRRDRQDGQTPTPQHSIPEALPRE